jgi:hypothetical protein
MFIHHFSYEIARLRVSRLNAGIQFNSLWVAGPLVSVSATEGERQLRHSVLDVGHWDARVNASIHSPDTVSSHRVSRLKAALTPLSWALLEKPPSRSASQEFLNILWNPKVHYHVHKSPPLVSTLSLMNLVHTAPCYFSKINLILSSRLGLGLPSGFFSFWLHHRNRTCIYFSSSPCVSCPAPLDLIILIIRVLSEEYKLQSSSLWKCLHPPSI